MRASIAMRDASAAIFMSWEEGLAGAMAAR